MRTWIGWAGARIAAAGAKVMIGDDSFYGVLDERRRYKPSATSCVTARSFRIAALTGSG